MYPINTRENWGSGPFRPHTLGEGGRPWVESVINSHIASCIVSRSLISRSGIRTTGRTKIRFLIIFESWENQEQCLLVLTQSSFWITPCVEVHIKLVKPHFAYYRKTVLPFVLSGILMTLRGLVVFLFITTGSECLLPFLLCWSPLDKDLNPFKFPNVLLCCSRILSFSWYFPLTPFLFASVIILERVIEICHLEIFLV